MAGISGLKLSELRQKPTLTFSIFNDESMCGMLFDIGMRKDPFDGYSDLKYYFSDNQAQVIHNLDEAVEMGLDNKFLSGVPYYHIKQYFDYVADVYEERGEIPLLYLMFSDCSTNFNAVQDLQWKAKGRLFQIGVWTERFLWKKTGDGYEFTNLVRRLQYQAEKLSGKVGRVENVSMPVSIILNANTAKIEGSQDNIVDFRKLPEGLWQDCQKVSVVLGQNGTSETHKMQESNINKTPVGFLGLAMACLNLAYAEECIGYVAKFDLNKNDTINNPELGFGDLTSAEPSSNDYTPIDNLAKTRMNIISQCGYILPVRYWGHNDEVFFSNSQTMSNGDYSTIPLNRIMHKCKRAMKKAALPYINGTIYIDPSTRQIAPSSAAGIAQEIMNAIDTDLVNLEGSPQINGRQIEVDIDQNILATDELQISLDIIPVVSANNINEGVVYKMHDWRDDTTDNENSGGGGDEPEPVE